MLSRAVLGAALAATLIGFVVVTWLPTANPYLAYLRYVCRHKFFVFLYCCTLGIPWRGLTHDLSKFTPSEFGPYARFFFGPPTPHGDARRAAFMHAWHFHYARNPHHWEHWVQPREGRSGVVAKMLRTYAISGTPIGVEQADDASTLEMIADWLAMAPTRRQTVDPFEDARQFYMAHRDEIILSPRARMLVEHHLAIPQVRETGWRDPLDVLRSQIQAPTALRENEPVVAPGGRRGIFLHYQRGKCVVRLLHTDQLIHVNEKDLHRVTA